jgi:hypothetical protein
MATPPLKTRFPASFHLNWRIHAHHPASLHFFLQPQNKIFPEKRKSQSKIDWL